MRTISAVSLLVLFGSIGAWAQSAAGSGAIIGNIRDPYGDGMPDAMVVLTNQALGIHSSFISSNDGQFMIPDLVPAGGYNLKITRQGYNDWEARGIEVHLGQTLDFRVVVQPNAPAAQVRPADVLPQPENTKFDLYNRATEVQVDALPSSQRRLETLVQLAPAGTQVPGWGTPAFHSEPFTSAVFTDGNETTNEYLYSPKAFIPLVVQDAMAEVQVMPATAEPEFGHAMGGFVNVVTRSGTDSLHGAAYGYFDDAKLNATDRSAPGFRPVGWQRQGGVSVGGPIRPKLFYFANFDYNNGSTEGLNRILNPLIANAQGTAVLPANCKSPATAAQCAAATSFLDSQMNATVPKTLSGLNGLAKIDWRPGESHSITLQGDASRWHSPNGSETEAVANNGGLLGYNGTYTDDTKYVKGGWSANVNNNVVNELRASLFHDRFSDYSDSKLLPSTGNLAINVAGTPVGANPAYPGVLSQNRYEFLENITAASGTHNVKLGANYSRSVDWMDQLYNQHGTYYYASLSAFAADFSSNTKLAKDYSAFAQSFATAFTTIRPANIAAYAQDTWTPVKHLLVNLGVRFDKAIISQPTQHNGSYYQTATIDSPNDDFAPRIGLSYQLGSHTVIRADAGFFYEPFVADLLAELYNGNGITQTTISMNPLQTTAPIFPKVFQQTLTATTVPSSSENLVFSTSKFRNPYTMTGSLAIERSLTRTTSITATLIHTRGVRLWTLYDLNPNIPTVTPNFTTVTKTYIIDNANGAQAGTYVTPITYAPLSSNAFAHLYQVTNSGTSQYNGATLQVDQRLWHGLLAQFSYTFSHATDDVSTPATLGFLGPGSQLSNPRVDEGTSSFDQRHRVVVDWVWQPTVSHSPGVASALLNGWQISGIVTVASGLPATPMVAVMGQQFTGVTLPYTNSLDGSGGWARVPFEPVNSLRAPRQSDLDARVSRTIPVGERIKVTLLIEAFNALNAQRDTSVQTLAYTAVSGVLRPVAGVGEGNGSYGFPYGTTARRAQVGLRIVF